MGRAFSLSLIHLKTTSPPRLETHLHFCFLPNRTSTSLLSSSSQIAAAQHRRRAHSALRRSEEPISRGGQGQELARPMDAATEASSPSSPSKQLREKLRTTVCCCFGGGASGASGAERTRWRRRGAAAGEFRYDALSYALNFDEGDDDDAYADPAAAFRYRNFNARLPPSPAAVGTQRQRATAIAIA